MSVVIDFHKERVRLRPEQAQCIRCGEPMPIEDLLPNGRVCDDCAAEVASERVRERNAPRMRLL